MNKREVLQKVRREVAAHLAMIEPEALAEWVGEENVAVAEDELIRIRRRLDPR